jgi:hypothetical protein
MTARPGKDKATSRRSHMQIALWQASHMVLPRRHGRRSSFLVPLSSSRFVSRWLLGDPGLGQEIPPTYSIYRCFNSQSINACLIQVVLPATEIWATLGREMFASRLVTAAREHPEEEQATAVVASAFYSMCRAWLAASTVLNHFLPND